MNVQCIFFLQTLACSGEHGCMIKMCLLERGRSGRRVGRIFFLQGIMRMRVERCIVADMAVAMRTSEVGGQEL